jgi:hypothetical protein
VRLTLLAALEDIEARRGDRVFLDFERRRCPANTHDSTMVRGSRPHACVLTLKTSHPPWLARLSFHDRRWLRQLSQVAQIVTAESAQWRSVRPLTDPPWSRARACG